MTRLVQILLVPFWIVGFIAAVIAVTAVAVWYATAAGYVDAKATWDTPLIIELFDDVPTTSSVVS